MIIRFSVENFRSIRDRQELTMVASSLKDQSESLIPIEQVGIDLVPVAAIYGANASGKTNVVQALNYMCQAVASSHRNWQPDKPIPRPAFALDDSPHRPSSFEIEFVVSQVRYQYGFSLDDLKIQEEWLYAYPNGKKQRWYARVETPARKFVFGRNLLGDKNRTIEALTRTNSLYLSAAAQNNHELLLPIYNFFANDIRFSFGKGPALETSNMCSDDKQRAVLLRYLEAADLGIAGVRVEDMKLEAPLEKAMSAFISALREVTPQSEVTIPKLVQPLFQHRAIGESRIEFGQENESGGTMAYFSLLAPVLKALDRGGVLCVDELDASLHPLLALEIVRNFTEKKLNPQGAQLIFNTHDTNLLDSSLLRRDQVWFTEKDSSGSTHLYPLSDFRPRKDENLKRGYLQGRYGAIPFIDRDMLPLETSD